MQNRKTSSALPHLRAVLTDGSTTGFSDRQLLERFANERARSVEAAQAAELAFEALVIRHGAMVWGICRRVLGDVHEAEDAFQATFLLLARKAGSLHVDDTLGRWLYGVAHRVAVRARFRAGRRASLGGEVPAIATDDPHGDLEQREIREIVGDEVDRLPLKYRCAIDLCYFQGMTHEQAARQLDWPLATVKSRLTRGRLRLRRGLARRGVAPFAAALTTALCKASRAAVPPGLVRSIVRSSAPRGAAAVPPMVARLMREVLQMMMWQKLRVAAATTVVFASITAAALAHRAPAAPPPRLLQAAANRQAAATVLRQNTPDPRWTRKLSSGTTVEVLAISPFPTGPDTWWRPDGTPLPRSPYDPSATYANVGENKVARITNQHLAASNVGDEFPVLRVLVARIKNQPAGEMREWQVKEATIAGLNRKITDGTRAGDLSEWIGSLPPSLKTCTVSFEVAADPWNTDITLSTSRGGSASTRASYIWVPVATERGTTLTVTHTLRDVLVRLIAVDLNDKEWPSQALWSFSMNELSQIEVDFPLPLERIKKFHVQIRPLELVEIPGVALERVNPD